MLKNIKKLFTKKVIQTQLPRLDNRTDIKFITIEQVKKTLTNNSFEELMNLYYLFLNRDLKIAEGVEKRRTNILNLEYEIHNSNKFIDDFLKDFDIYRLLHTLSDAIYYGYSLCEIVYDIKDGKVLPKGIKDISPLAVQYEEWEDEYFLNDYEFNRTNIKDIDSRKLIFYRHSSEVNYLQNSSNAYKMLYYAILKHTVMGYNLQYFDSLAVPPLIVTSSDLNDEKKIQELSTQLMSLKSNSFGIFSENEKIDTITVSNKANFDTTIKYYDNIIAQFLTGGSVISDGSSGGSYSLAQSQERRLMEKTKFDARLIENEVTRFLNQVLSINFESFEKVKFEFIYPTVTKEEPTQQKEFNSKKANQFNNKDKPLTIQEKQLSNTNLNPIQREFKEALKILQNSSSYEEAVEKIEKLDNPKLEQMLENIIFGSIIEGLSE
jgi:phage gp29-like protein